MKLNKLKSKVKYDLSKRRKCRKIHSSLTDSFKDKIIYKFYFVQYLMKRFFLSILLILVDSGTAQIAFFIVLNGLSLTYWAILRPYKKVFYNIVLLVNEAVFLWIGFFMIAFLDTQKDFSVLGIVLIALLTVNLIGLFVVSSVYELINLIKFIKSKRSVLRSDMRVVKPKITKRVELNRRKLPDALPQIDGTLIHSFRLLILCREIQKAWKIGKY